MSVEAIPIVQQYHFEPDSSDNILKISPNPIEPETYNTPRFWGNLATLRINIEYVNNFSISDNEDTRNFFERIVRLWFKSKIASPAPDIKNLYKQLLESSGSGEQTSYSLIWENINRDFHLGKILDYQLEDTLIQTLVEKGFAPNAKKAVELIKETIITFGVLADCLKDYIEWIEYLDYDDPDSVIIQDQHTNLRYAKQLLLQGIVVRVQSYLLTAKQKDAIHRIPVPRSFRATRQSSLDEIIKSVEELN